MKSHRITAPPLNGGQGLLRDTPVGPPTPVPAIAPPTAATLRQLEMAAEAQISPEDRQTVEVNLQVLNDPRVRNVGHA